MATRKTAKTNAPFIAPILTCYGYAAASSDATAKAEYKRLLDNGKEDVAKAQLYTGYIMYYANAALDDGDAFEAAASQFKLADKARNESARKACVAARKAWSRLRGAFNHIVRHGNAGNSNAGKGAKDTAKPEAAKPEAAKAVKVAPVMPDVMTRAALLQGVADAIATYISKGKAMPDVASADIAAMAAGHKLITARLKIKFD